MNEADIKKMLDARISRERAKELLIELVKVPSPQTELLEDEPLLKAFIKTAVEPRLRARQRRLWRSARRNISRSRFSASPSSRWPRSARPSRDWRWGRSDLPSA